MIYKYHQYNIHARTHSRTSSLTRTIPAKYFVYLYYDMWISCNQMSYSNSAQKDYACNQTEKGRYGHLFLLIAKTCKRLTGEG